MIGIREVLGALRGHPVGQIYWLNLCAHVLERAIDLQTVRSVLEQVWHSYRSAYAAEAPPNAGAVLLQALLTGTSHNRVAVDAMRRTKPLDLTQVNTLRTVLDGRSLWEHYLILKPAAYDFLQQDLAWKTGALDDNDETAIASTVLQECARRGMSDLRPHFGKHAKETMLRTRAPRFWAGIPTGERPSEPRKLAGKLGIMGWSTGTWLVELVYRREDVERDLTETGSPWLRRPSALCPTDLNLPRFRALAPAEVDSLQRDEPLDAFGSTVDLNEWHAPADAQRTGLPELICPAIRWHPNLLPDQIVLLGQVDQEITAPGNDEYASYLRQALSLSEEKENRALTALLEPQAAQPQ
jgi:hypothetical protein